MYLVGAKYVSPEKYDSLPRLQLHVSRDRALDCGELRTIELLEPIPKWQLQRQPQSLLLYPEPDFCIACFQLG